MYLTHYAQVTDVPRLAADLHRLIDAHVAVAERHAAVVEGRKALIEADLWKLVDEESARQGWTLPQAEVSSCWRWTWNSTPRGWMCGWAPGDGGGK